MTLIFDYETDELVPKKKEIVFYGKFLPNKFLSEN